MSALLKINYRWYLTILFLITVSGAIYGFSSDDKMEFYNEFDPKKPTIIAAHGWLGNITYEHTFGRSPAFSQRANLIGWEWDANILFNITAKARASGQQLAREFSRFILTNYPEYKQPLQLLGHSLGAHVMLSASAELREMGRTDPHYAAYQVSQITLIDTGFNEEIPELIQSIQSDHLVKPSIENYWSPASTGGKGRHFAGDIINVEVPLEHMLLWYWYFASLENRPADPLFPGANYSVVGLFPYYLPASSQMKMVKGQSTPKDIRDDVFQLVQ